MALVSELVRNPLDHKFVCDTLAAAGRQIVDELHRATFLQNQRAAVDPNSQNQQQQEPLHGVVIQLVCRKFLQVRAFR